MLSSDEHSRSCKRMSDKLSEEQIVLPHSLVAFVSGRVCYPNVAEGELTGI